MMRSRRASRLVAVTAIVFLAASGAGACLYPRTAAAAKECCRTHCHDGTGSFRSCCCKDPAPQTTSEAASDARPLAFAPLAAGIAAPSAAAASTAVTLVPRVTTGPPGFLQRCTLLL